MPVARRHNAVAVASRSTDAGTDRSTRTDTNRSVGTGKSRSTGTGDEARLRSEICRVGKSLFDRGYVHATAGNISVRLDDGFLITATDACLGFLEPEAIARVDAEGQPLPGPRASKTIVLHRRIYAEEPEAACIVHTHSTALVALSLRERSPGSGADLLPPITPYFVMKVGRVPLIDYHRPGDPAVADRVAEAIRNGHAAQAPIRAVMLARLGPVVWQASPGEAMAVLEELDETARLWLAADPKPAPLDAAQIDALRMQFGARWSP